MADGAARLRGMFAETAAAGRAALLPYMTAGLPTVAASPGLFEAMAEAGADGFEVGIPYSDPLMDGPTIHEAGLRALAAGSGLEPGLDVVAAVTARTGKPVVVMTYANPVVRVGIEEFARRVADAGGAGVIVADMPVDEAGVFAAAFADHGLGLALFVAPTTPPDRLSMVADSDPVFVYGVADMGVTGERTEASGRAAALAARVRAATDVPLVLGVGISTPAQAQAAAKVADGVIVGSALVRRVLDAADVDAAAAGLRHAVVDLAAAMRRP
ncbi:MAG: tryptophan synthase subunit alpha [Acidimicrobiia bacterium]|jgi:tryptophan synthase alpha chain